MQVGENQPATDFFLDNFLLNHFGGYVVPMLDQCWAIHLRAPQNRSGGCSWAYVGPFGGYGGPCWAMLKLRWGDWLMEEGIFVGHEPCHLRAPQNVQIGRLLSQWLGRVPTEENIFGWAFLGHSSLSWNYSVAMLNV